VAYAPFLALSDRSRAMRAAKNPFRKREMIGAKRGPKYTNIPN
jgi:hypothetical protein